MMKNKQNLSPKELCEENRLLEIAAHDHLIDFSILTNHNYSPNWHHEIIADTLEDIESGEFVKQGNRILMIFVPPRHGKSEEASINFPAWFLGKNPMKEVITSSYSSELALDFGKKTRELVDSNTFSRIFNVRLKNDEHGSAKWKTNKGGSYTSVGIGGPITGRGADVLLIDDPIKNREEAESEIIRRKHWDWFISTAWTRLEPNGVVILILTRWHLEDLAGMILKDPTLKSLTKIIRFPAIAEEDEQYRKKGEALWPARYPLSELEMKRKSSGPYEWSSLYQQTPIMTANQEFKLTWFKSVTRQAVKRLNTKKFLTIDTALSKKDGSDYFGFCENYVDNQNNWNISAYKMRFNADEFVDFLFTIQSKRKFDKIGIEKTAYLVGLKPFIESEMKRRNIFFTIVELEHKGVQKELRIRGLIPRASNGQIYLIEGECDDLKDQMVTFPRSTNDDVLDATAYQTQIVEDNLEKKKFSQPTPEPVSEFMG